jgi:hypothetical protein
MFNVHTFPAAVVWPVKKRPKLLDASKTALYPAILAIELARASKSHQLKNIIIDLNASKT